MFCFIDVRNNHCFVVYLLVGFGVLTMFYGLRHLLPHSSFRGWWGRIFFPWIHSHYGTDEPSYGWWAIPNEGKGFI